MHYQDEQPGVAPPPKYELEVTMSLLLGLVSRVGNIMPIFAHTAQPGLIDFMSVPIAVNEGTASSDLINFFKIV